ncbi:MAG: PIN domain-containing protein [Armatimonadetes bacterium]|nr:PIN domain-containing protein [Armatimonadota bacterium]
MSRPQVFVDSWAWVAIAIRSDPGHSRARDLRRAAERCGALLVTSDMVMAELLTRLRYDAGLAVAASLADDVEVTRLVGAVDVVYTDERTYGSALDWFRRFDH